MNEKSRDKMCCLPMRKKVANIVTLRFYSRRDNSVEFISSSLTKNILLVENLKNCNGRSKYYVKFKSSRIFYIKCDVEEQANFQMIVVTAEFWRSRFSRHENTALVSY